MSHEAESLLARVLALPPDDVTEFLSRLHDIWLPEGDESEAEATALWEAELDQRLVAVADGSARSLPLADAMTEARAELAKRMRAR